MRRVVSSRSIPCGCPGAAERPFTGGRAILVWSPNRACTGLIRYSYSRPGAISGVVVLP